MKTLKIKQLKSVVIVFALLIIGSLAIASNGKNEEKISKQEVKVDKNAILVPLTFEIDVSSAIDQNNPSQQIITGEGVTDPSCGTSNVTICSAELDLNPSDPLVMELRDKIANNETVTIQDFLNIDPNLHATYSKKP